MKPISRHIEQELALNPKPKRIGRSESITNAYNAIRDSFYYEIGSFGNFQVADEKRDLAQIICHGLQFTFFSDHRTKKVVQVNGAVDLQLADHEMENIYKQLNKTK